MFQKECFISKCCWLWHWTAVCVLHLVDILKQYWPLLFFLYNKESLWVEDKYVRALFFFQSMLLFFLYFCKVSWKPWGSSSIIKHSFDLWICNFCIISAEERGRIVLLLTDSPNSHERWAYSLKPETLFFRFCSGNKQCNNAWPCIVSVVRLLIAVYTASIRVPVLGVFSEVSHILYVFFGCFPFDHTNMSSELSWLSTQFNECVFCVKFCVLILPIHAYSN